jgi:glycosyltransferase involved in cell wall biosynthesis
MRVAVLNTAVPFVRGGAEVLAERLCEALAAEGHEAQLISLPYVRHDPADLAVELESVRRWRIRGIDRLIALKFPVHLVPHENKVLWLLHQHRPAYDLWDTRFGGMGPTAQGLAARDLVRRADERWLPEAKAIHAISEPVAARLKRFNRIDAPVLHPPLPYPEQYRAEGYGDYVFCPARLALNKRQALLIKALRYTRSGVRLVLAGTPMSHRELRRLQGLATLYGVRRRVTILPSWIEEGEKVRLYARARAVAYVPFDEDYGFVPLEAAAAERPVVTCTDSGGTHLLVREGESGRVVAPDPRALARAFDELVEDDALAERLGRGARARLDALALDWGHVARTLLAG